MEFINMKDIRKVMFSVTNFLYCDNDYLMLLRNSDRNVDAGRLNGIGGKLEAGENFLDAAIRETEEETGYRVNINDVKLKGIIKLHGGYPDDWVMCFFKIKVENKNIPLSSTVKEGKLLWIPENKVLNSGYTLVDDLNYCWKHIIGDDLFFATVEVGSDEKVKKISVSTLSIKP